MKTVDRAMADTQTEVRQRITQLDGLRGVAILMVFIFHAFHANLLWMGVDLFFVLSGFLITGILLDGKSKPFGAYIGGFYRRRARRILPAYIVALVIAAALFGVGWLSYWYLYLGAMNLVIPLGLTSLTVLPLWSLAVEEQFYLIWPVAVYFLSRRHIAILAVSLLLLAPVLRFIFTPHFISPYSIYMLLPFRMDTLAAGALIAIVWPEIQDRMQKHSELRVRIVIFWSCGFAIALIAALVLNSLGYKPNSGSRIGNTVLLEATLAITTSLFVLTLLGVGKSSLSSRPMVKLGRISYSIYLIHLTALAIAPNNNVVIAAIGSVIYASAMWAFVEEPILNSRRLLSRFPNWSLQRAESIRRK